jgi:hypothetical protein
MHILVFYCMNHTCAYFIIVSLLKFKFPIVCMYNYMVLTVYRNMQVHFYTEQGACMHPWLFIYQSNNISRSISTIYTQLSGRRTARTYTRGKTQRSMSCQCIHKPRNTLLKLLLLREDGRVVDELREGDGSGAYSISWRRRCSSLPPPPPVVSWECLACAAPT